MATTGANLVQYTNAGLHGATVGAAAALGTMHPTAAKQLTLAGSVTRLDVAHVDLANTAAVTGQIGNFAKNGGSYTTLSGTTPVTLSLADLTSNSTSSTGDTAFATWNVIVLKVGSADVTFAPGASNPLTIMSGTSPTITLFANSTYVFHNPAGGTVDSTHKTILITPTSGGSISLAVGGA